MNPKNQIRITVTTMVIFFSLVLFSCSKDDKITPTTPIPVAGAGGGSSKDVSISNFGFAPDPLVVSVGQTVTWTNSDSMDHTVTSDTGVFSSGSLANGQTFSYTFSTAGSFDYHCAYHPDMIGTVIVQ